MTAARSILLFVLAALAEIGGAWLVWQGVREHRGWGWIGAGIVALGLYGFVATLQPEANFGRILPAYGGVFVAGSPLWGMTLDGFRPGRWDVTGAVICLIGVAVIMPAALRSRANCSPMPEDAPVTIDKREILFAGQDAHREIFADAITGAPAQATPWKRSAPHWPRSRSASRMIAESFWQNVRRSSPTFRSEGARLARGRRFDRGYD